MTQFPGLLGPIAGAIAGAIAGSFLATLILRWPADRQVVSGRSSCDSCRRTLGLLDLVPIGSWLWTRGRCRSCGERIDPLHLWVELAAAGAGGLALLLAPGLRGIVLALMFWQLLALALLDARHYWLPDRLTLLLAVTGLGLAGLAPGAPLAQRLIGGGLGFASLWLIATAYRRLSGREGLGAGDAKLLGAIGCWLGWMALAPVVLMASLGGLAVALVTRRKRLDHLPFGTFLAAAAGVWTIAAALR